MPDHCCLQNDRTSELQEILLSRIGYHSGDIKKERSNSKKFDLSLLHGRGHVHRDLRSKGQSAPKKSRGKESSKHFGVRFRPDLHKWVAEIRVAEWKSVDKKVWLGTFDTEVGAARAVDAARKLLKCKKKRPPNFPCLNLDAYLETIPSHLNLNHLGNEAMFKEVTLFVKQKAQEYAASFCTTTPSNCVSVVTSHPVPVTSFYSQSTKGLNLQEDFSFKSQTSFISSCENSNLPSCEKNNLPSCEALPTSALSTICSSNFKEEELHWEHLYDGSVSQQTCSFDTLGLFHNYVDLKIDEQSMVECETLNAKSQLSWEEQNLSFPYEIGDDELSPDDVLFGSEYLSPSDNQAYLTQERTSMDIVSEDEMPNNSFSIFSDISFQKPASSIVDTSMDWLLPPLHSFSTDNSFLMNSLDCPQVC